jgi:hypothetical protein
LPKSSGDNVQQGCHRQSIPSTNHEKEAGVHKRRDFLLFVILAAAAATPTWGQTVVPAAGPANSDKQGAPSIQDFSGIWAHLTWPDFEPPPS